MKSTRRIFKTKMLIYQSKANINVKTLFREDTCLMDPENQRVLVRMCMGTKIPHFILVRDSLGIEIQIQYNCSFHKFLVL